MGSFWNDFGIMLGGFWEFGSGLGCGWADLGMDRRTGDGQGAGRTGDGTVEGLTR